MTYQPGIAIREPVALLQREVRADFRKLTEAVLKGAVDTLKGDWCGAAKTWGSGFLEGFGLKPETPQELAWRVVYTTLRQAALSLVEEHREFLVREPDDPEALPDELELRLTEVEIRIVPAFLSEAWRLALVRDFQQPLKRWLLAFGVAEQRAVYIARQLPQRFGYCLWDEWARHRAVYAPLEQALQVPVEPPPNLDEMRRAYLAYLRDSYRNLDLKGLPGIVEAVEKASGLALAAVYVAIHGRSERPAGETWERDPAHGQATADGEGAETRQRATPADPVDLETVLGDAPALVILGDPGAGKSTLLKHHTLRLAEDPLAPLPILLPLNQYAAALEREPLPLRRFLPRYFASRRDALAGVGPLFEQAMDDGRAVILLDGLDEVGSDRGALVRRVEDFVREIVPAPDADPRDSGIPPGNRVAVTSRFVGYAEAALGDPRWRTYAVVDWDREGIERFVERWTYAVELAIAGGRPNPEAQARAEQEARELVGAIFANPHIERLAGNPLLLTILTLIKRQGVTLPHRRVELYELYLETLVSSWRKARALDRTPVGPDVDYHSAWYVLAALGLWIRETSPQLGLAEERQMREFLNRYFRDQEGYGAGEAKVQAKAFIESVHTYSSLLVERGPGQYGFLHQTFGEYLAGCGLTEDEEAEAKLLRHLHEAGWHEAILLGIGALGIVRKDRRRAGALLQAVLEAQPPPERRGENVLLAGEALRDVGTVGINKPVADRITRALITTMQDTQVGAKERQAAGRLLGETGWRPEDLDCFIEIPPGDFLYGEAKAKRTMPSRYWIARYPVTHAQYARFVAAGGYRQEALWSPAGWNWRRETGAEVPGYWEDDRWNNPIFPVVGVSWYEAEAYTHWLDRQIRSNGFETEAGRTTLPTRYRCALPSEEQWERAARGSDGRRYPWGDRFEAYRANVAKTLFQGIDTTAVCTYPQGQSPHGVWDPAGNVLEWMFSGWEKSDRRRVLRGGAFNFAPDFARCASRRVAVADARLDHGGFRVVLSPLPLTDETSER